MSLENLKHEIEQEQAAISNWWLTHSVDKKHGGFYGAIDVNNRVIQQANKGIIQNTRILWYFSEAAYFSGRSDERQAAERAYEYLIDYFWDDIHGGVVWELDYQGKMVNGRKQLYAQAFAIYALSAYFRLTNNEDALLRAKALFELIERHGIDPACGGYLEAFDQQWQTIGDLRLSPKDLNWPKTMNTHLHIMEAYTALYHIAPSPELADALKRLIAVITRYFISDDFHLLSFFDLEWNNKSDTYSYGHDIECSWLLWAAACVLNEENVMSAIKPQVLGIAEKCLRCSLGERGEVMDGYDFVHGKPLTERVWWIQAEAMVGFLNAYELTLDPRYLVTVNNLWVFIKRFHIDPNFGEWRWLSTLDSSTRFDDHKSGFWKGPYHNGRAMIEMTRRLIRLQSLSNAAHSM